MGRTAVILVQYNNLSETQRCIESLLHHHAAAQIVVVDNGSAGNVPRSTLMAMPGIQVISLTQNLGFGRANNVGIRWAMANTDCVFFFVLNNDTVIQPGTIERLEAALDGDSDVGVTAPRIVFMDDPDVLWYGGGEINWYKGGPLVPAYRQSAVAASALRDRRVTFASGCAMLIRRAVLQEVGGFDPRYFMYEEDTEFCLRVLEAGWSIRYVSAAVVWHKGQGSQRRAGEQFVPLADPHHRRLPFLMYHLTKNRLLNMHSHARGQHALAFYTMFPLLLLYRSARYGAYGRWDAVRSIWEGIKAYFVARKESTMNELAGWVHEEGTHGNCTSGSAVFPD